MPRCHHALQGVPGSIPASVLASDANPTLKRSTASGAAILWFDIEQCWKITDAILELVRMDIDHQCDPITPAIPGYTG
jgi:hypothetical protein